NSHQSLNANECDRPDVEDARENWRKTQAKREQERRGQHQPGNHSVKGSLRRVEQQQCACDSSGQADDQHRSKWKIRGRLEVVAIGPGAAKIPGSSAIVLDALAMMDGTPVKISAGKVKKEP